jgi:hypothetical protein
VDSFKLHSFNTDFTMADEPEIATKAPESDAQEDKQPTATITPATTNTTTTGESMFVGDTPAQEGVSMGVSLPY